MVSVEAGEAVCIHIYAAPDVGEAEAEAEDYTSEGEEAERVYWVSAVPEVLEDVEEGVV